MFLIDWMKRGGRRNIIYKLTDEAKYHSAKYVLALEICERITKLRNFTITKSEYLKLTDGEKKLFKRKII